MYKFMHRSRFRYTAVQYGQDKNKYIWFLISN